MAKKAAEKKKQRAPRDQKNLGRRSETEILVGPERENAAWLIYGATQLTKPDVDEMEAAIGSDITTIRNWAAGYGVPSVAALGKLKRFFGERGVVLSFEKGTLSFSIEKAVAGGVTPRRLKR